MKITRTWVVEKEQAEKIRDESHRKRISQSEIIRKAVDRYFEEVGK